MKTGGIILIDVVCLLVLWATVKLLRRRLLTIGLGVSWIATAGGLMLLVTVPPLRQLWVSLSSSLFDSPPYLVALTLFLLIFLLHLSVVVSILQRQVRETGQFIGLNRAGADNGDDTPQK